MTVSLIPSVDITSIDAQVKAIIVESCCNPDEQQDPLGLQDNTNLVERFAVTDIDFIGLEFNLCRHFSLHQIVSDEERRLLEFPSQRAKVTVGMVIHWVKVQLNK